MTEAELAVTAPATAESRYDLGWVKRDDGSSRGFVLRSDIWIDAPPDVVWSLVRNPNGYGSFNKALTAQVGTMAIGQPIELDIRMFGDGLPATHSTEKIAIFDEELHVASWDRDFGLGQVTHRPQLLVAERGGTHYYTALELPRSFGWIVVGTVGFGIKAAFGRFGAGLRDAAERL